MEHKVVIVGGGFAGLHATQNLRKSPVQITLLDRRNFHLFQPLLYQVATGTVAPGDISSPLRLILERQENARVLWAEVIAFDIPMKQVILENGDRIPFDTLIVASGSEPNYFGHENWRALAPGLKTIEDATAMRSRILSAFESAEREQDLELVKSWLTFVVVGAGPTGVELAGALAEVAQKTLREGFHHIHPENSKILMINADPQVLPGYPKILADKAEKALNRLGVKVQNNTIVTDVLVDAVVLGTGPSAQRIPTKTVLWTAGVRASPLGKLIAQATSATLDRQGRVQVQPDLSIAGHPTIFVIGDLANPSTGSQPPLPGVAPVAIQEGRYVAEVITNRLQGKISESFKYNHQGSLATIGRNSAVADFGWIKFDGFLAWIAWAFIHIAKLVEFENRIMVMIQWIWNYTTWRRSDLLITHAPPFQNKDKTNTPKTPSTTP